MEALKAVDEVTQKLGMVRILRNIVFTEAHLLEVNSLSYTPIYMLLTYTYITYCVCFAYDCV